MSSEGQETMSDGQSAESSREPTGATLVSVCQTGDIPDGEMRRFELVGLPAIALYHVAGEFFATADRCTHGGASLTGEGTLDGFVVECGWHQGSFDIRTGDGVASPCKRPLRIYRVAVRDDGVFLALTPTQALEAGL